MKLLNLSKEQIQDYNNTKIKCNIASSKVIKILTIVSGAYFGIMGLGAEVLGMRLLYFSTCVLSVVLVVMLNDINNFLYTKEDDNVLISNDWRLRKDRSLEIDGRLVKIDDTDYNTLRNTKKHSIIGIEL